MFFAISTILLAFANIMTIMSLKALRERVERLEGMEANRQIKERYERRATWKKSE